MSKFYTSKYDRVFKSIFCKEDAKEKIITLLESILKKKISSLTFYNNELIINNVNEKNKIIDVLVSIDGTYVHIELNSTTLSYLHNRNFIYFSEIYSKKIRRGEVYNNTDNFIHIDLTYGLTNDKDVSKYYVMDKDYVKYVDNIEIIEFNMDRLKTYWYNGDKEKFEKYKYLIMLDLTKEELEKIEKDEFMEEYKKEVERLNEDKTFVSAMTYEEDQRLIMNTEKKISFEEGIQEGLEQGIEQNQADVIKNMRKQNFTLEQISNVVELPIDKIKDILKMK